MAEVLTIQHIKTRKDLVSEIDKLVESANDDEMVTIYRVLNDIINH